MLKRISAFETELCRPDDDPLYDTRSSGSRGFVEVEVTLRNGTTDSVRVHKAPGHPSRELSWENIEAKFGDCARNARISPADGLKVFAALRDLEHCGAIHALVEQMHH
jgi:2-methylcitrate dehydratase PrpD